MIRNFFRDETGLELSEYAVAAALVAIAAVVAFTTLGNAISTKINTLAATISGWFVSSQFARRALAETNSLRRTLALSIARERHLERSKDMLNFLRDESGLELSEYAVAAALVAIAAVVAFTTLGNVIASKVNTLAATISG
jgi:pilus assembly protein Flp/PilA